MPPSPTRSPYSNLPECFNKPVTEANGQTSRPLSNFKKEHRLEQTEHTASGETTPKEEAEMREPRDLSVSALKEEGANNNQSITESDCEGDMEQDMMAYEMSELGAILKEAETTKPVPCLMYVIFYQPLVLDVL
ncbi:unnamed protein product [Protopolystoma xenopodis]|uniref:Uncharacterized protein n=1 Tax=Protopolystoma xenopodis TaxID=117903 RepID=A0A3S5AA72_9PLAT|nr:unnamed protein product [Protopolystoma xenopodis]